jgi:hypothetical protein
MAALLRSVQLPEPTHNHTGGMEKAELLRVCDVVFEALDGFRRGLIDIGMDVPCGRSGSLAMAAQVILSTAGFLTEEALPTMQSPIGPHNLDLWATSP